MDVNQGNRLAATNPNSPRRGLAACGRACVDWPGALWAPSGHLPHLKRLRVGRGAGGPGREAAWAPGTPEEIVSPRAGIYDNGSPAPPKPRLAGRVLLPWAPLSRPSVPRGETSPFSEQSRQGNSPMTRPSPATGALRRRSLVGLPNAHAPRRVCGRGSGAEGLPWETLAFLRLHATRLETWSARRRQT